MRQYLIFIAIAFAACQSETAKQPVSTSEVKTEPPKAKIVGDFTESLNGAKEQTTIDSLGRIQMTSGPETDFFTEPGQPPYDKANAPLLLRTIDNTKPFTFSFKTTPVHMVKYDAGMAFLYVDDHHWLKFAFEADERMKTRIVTVKTKDVSDDNNHDVVANPSVYLKISSDTKVVGFYYSTDGQDWQLVRVFKNEYPANLKIGIGTQSPAGKGNQSVFEDFKFEESSVKDFRMGI